MRDRTFRVKYRTTTGVIYSGSQRISAGLPQGGVLSPLLWLAFFNEVHSDLEALRREAGLPVAYFWDLLFADDITIVMIADSLQQCSDNANISAELVYTALKKRHLEIQREKTQSLLLQPDIAPQGVFRRSDRTVVTPTKKRLQEQRTREACHSEAVRATVLDFDPTEDPSIAQDGEITQHSFSFPLFDEVRILGILFDRHLTMDGHYASTLTKARLRQALFARMTHTT